MAKIEESDPSELTKELLFPYYLVFEQTGKESSGDLLLPGQNLYLRHHGEP
jgi:hypothetical protein